MLRGSPGALRKDASKRCARKGCQLDVLCMHEGGGKGLQLLSIEGGGGRCLCRLEGQGYPGPLQQVQPGRIELPPQAAGLGTGGCAGEDCKARIDVLVRLSANDEAGLPGLEASVADLLTELD